MREIACERPAGGGPRAGRSRFGVSNCEFFRHPVRLERTYFLSLIQDREIQITAC